MFQRSDIRKALKAWADAVTGLTFVKQNQSAPRPAKPYGTYKITSYGLNEGVSDNIIAPIAGTPTYSDRPVISRIAGARSMVVSCQVYDAVENGDVSGDKVELIQKSISNPLTNHTYFKRKQIDQVNVVTAENDTVYTVTITGVDIEITSDADATATEIRNALVTAINENLYINDVVAAKVDSFPGSFTVTGAFNGQQYSISVDDNMATSNTQTALDLALVDAIAVTDLTFFDNPDWEPRMVIDVRVNYNASIEADLGAIESIAATGTVDGLSIPITVP